MVNIFCLDKNQNEKECNMERKKIVIDTNIAIDDPECLYKFGKNDVVIPLVVYEELNEIKDESGTERGFLAREFLKNLTKIQQLALNGEENCLGKNFVNGILLNDTKIYLDIEKVIDDKEFFLDLSKNDNKIIYCAYNLKKKNQNVILVSNDVGVRFAAIELNIKAQQYKANKIDKKELYTGYREVYVDSQFINDFYKIKKISNTYDLYPNEFIIFVDKNNITNRAIGRCKIDVYADKDNLGEIHLLSQDKNSNLYLKTTHKIIKPKNIGQRMLCDLLQDDNVKIITITGMPGVGKTLLPVADALEKVEDGKYKKFLYCKSVIPTDKSEEIGYFKGDMIDKLANHLQGLYSTIEFLYEKEIYEGKHKKDLNEIVDSLISNNQIELKSLATIRGASIQNRYIMLDEAQNVNAYMMKTIITRVCEDCKLIIAGDLNQIDTKHLHKYNNGLARLIAKGKEERHIAHINLDINGKSARGSIATFGNKI